MRLLLRKVFWRRSAEIPYQLRDPSLYRPGEDIEVPIEGSYCLELVYNGNVADLSIPDGPLVVNDGPQEFDLAFTVIKEAKFVPAYELNTLILLLGLNEKRPYRVQTLLDPPRIVIGVKK